MRGGVIVVAALAGCGRIDFGASQPPMQADAAAPMTWWDTSYGMRAQLTIENVSADALAMSYPIELPFDSPIKDALRVVYLDPITQAWTEQNRYTEGTFYWFDLLAPLAPGAKTTDFWIYFDNPAPTTPPGSGNTVFTFYDGFSATTINASKWVVSGAPTEVGNQLVLGNYQDTVRSTMTFGPGYALFVNMTTPSNPETWLGFQRMNDFVDDIPWMLWIERTTADTYYPAGVPVGSIWPEVSLAAGTFDQGTTGARVLDGAEHLFTILRVVDRVVFKFDEQEVYEVMLPAADSESLQIRFTNDGTTPVKFDTMHVALAVWPEPVVTIGAPEAQ